MNPVEKRNVKKNNIIKKKNFNKIRSIFQRLDKKKNNMKTIEKFSKIYLKENQNYES